MPVTRISEKLSVSSQPNAQKLSVLDRSGFKTLINNRPITKAQTSRETKRNAMQPTNAISLMRIFRSQ